ncbi:MAG: 16S rRNA (adenine(1518)-N(6)/adenine(1519)-N(6))-dimethyltransferase RsmA [Flavobacteriales bacterium]|nr:16S rRNA (adenine(1518)-N(6)/adenine(1519)-N(6))-dimethyltransferase RsmA [Flavobacteriales bacterium]
MSQKEVRAKKYLGQHFLKDLSIAQDIVDACLPTLSNNVLEVGPGMGVLTQYLLQKDMNVRVAEIDTESVEYLKLNFPQLHGRIIEGDFLKMNLCDVFHSEPFTLIGNFPYNISSQIMFHALDYTEKIPQIVGMFQKEVAERLTATHGSKVYGILSVLLKVYYDTEYLFTVDENVFNPPPKVKSGVIRLVRKTDIPNDFDPEMLKKIVKAGFNQRRKTLRNALKPLGIPPLVAQSPYLDMRAEQLPYTSFLELTRLYTADK